MSHALRHDLWQTLVEKRRIMAAVLPGVALALLNSNVFDLPHTDMIDAFASDRYRIQWVFGAYLLGGALGMALTRTSSMRFGLRETYVGALLLFALAAALAGSATQVVWMTPARFVQGLAMGLSISSGMILLWREFPIHRELAMALYGMAVYVPSLAGAVVGGLATAWISWRMIFWIDIPLALAMAAVAWRLLPPDRSLQRSSMRFDFFGAMILICCVISLNVIVDLGQYWGWTNSRFLVSWLVGGIVAVMAFVVWGLYGQNPLIALRPLARRHFAYGLAIKVAFTVNLYVVLEMVSSYMINLRHYQWWQGALVIAAALIAMIIGIVMGVLIGSNDNRKLRMSVGLIIMSLTTWQLAVLDVYTAKTLLAAILAVWGWGAGLVCGPALTTTFERLSFQQAMEGAGVFNIARTLPAFVVGGLAITLVVRHGDENFDWYRLDIQHNRPVVQQALRDVTQHAINRGSDHTSASRQAHAVLTGWVHANSTTYGYQDVFRFMALVPCIGLIFVAAVHIPTTDDAHEDAAV